MGDHAFFAIPLVVDQSDRREVGLKLNEDEFNAMMWLLDTLKKISRSNGHRSQAHAINATRAFNNMRLTEVNANEIIGKLREVIGGRDKLITKLEGELRALNHRCDSLELILDDEGDETCTDASCDQCKTGEPCR